VLDLARFDLNYDIRDRARMIRAVVLDKDNRVPTLHEHAKQLLIHQKPAPTISGLSERQRFMLGSLSHIVNHSALGYQVLPDFPEVAPDPSVRIPPGEKWDSTPVQSPRRPAGKKDSFWSDEEGSEASEKNLYEEYTDEEEHADDRSGVEEEEEEVYDNKKGAKGKTSKDKYTDEEEDDYYEDDKYSDEYYSDEYYSDEYDDGDRLPPAKTTTKTSTAPPPAKTTATNGASTKAATPASATPTSSAKAGSSKASPAPAPPAAQPQKVAPSSSSNDLDDLFSFGPSKGSGTSTSKLTNDLSGLDFSSNTSTSPTRTSNFSFSSSGSLAFTPPTQSVRKTLLKSAVGGGLEIEYSFLRRGGSMHGAQVNTVLLNFKNQSDRPIVNIRVGKQTLAPGMTLVPFLEIKELAPGATTEQSLSITFSNATQPAKFEILHERGTYNVSLPPSIGDLFTPVELSPQEFADLQKKLGGMHESNEPISISEDNVTNVPRIVQTVAYLANIPTTQEGKYKFAGKTLLADQGIILVSIDINAETGIGKCSINCENTILASVLQRAIVSELIKD